MSDGGNPNPPSGVKPGEQQGGLRPTVIKTIGEAPQLPQPTVIGEKPKRVVREPTVIGGGTSVQQPTKISTPTAIPPGPKKIEKPPVPAVSKPTAIPGVERRRLPVTLDELKTLNPASKSPTLEAALRLIQTTSLDELTDRDVILWGNEPQRKYGELVSHCLTLSQDNRLSKVNEHIARLMEILGSINLKKVCQLGGSGDTVLTRFIGKRTTAIDTAEELTTAQKEISQLVKLMGKQLDPLLTLRDELEKVSRQIDELGDEVEKFAIAATYLADYLHRHRDHLRVGLEPRFTERAMSLTQTLVQIRSSSSMRQVQIEQPIQLITTVQQVALITVPTWLGSIVSLKTMLDGKHKPTVTEIGELDDQKQEILQKLKGQ